MFSFIRGKLHHATPSSVTLDCNGVGYLIAIPTSIFSALPPLGKEVLLHTSFVVREQSHALYGFLTADECKLFERLLDVNGIGPKTALSLIAHLPTPKLEEAVQQNDVHALCKVPGVGKKTAQRLLIDMRDKITLKSRFVTSPNQKLQDAISALINLGYTQMAAENALQKVLQEQPENQELATLITLALKHC